MLSDSVNDNSKNSTDNTQQIACCEKGVIFSIVLLVKMVKLLASVHYVPRKHKFQSVQLLQDAIESHH